MRTFLFLSFMLFLGLILSPSLLNARTFSLETDVYAASQPSLRRGLAIEVWLFDFISLGTSRDTENLTDENFKHTVENSQPLYLRIQLGGFFARSGTLESLHSVQLKNSLENSIQGRNRTAFLTGVRSSVGYMFEYSIYLFSVGWQEESTNSEIFTFDDGSSIVVERQYSNLMVILGFMF
ncbi:MAG: hypothetical protein HQM11_19050 [SAR324 cluster bacterium]|nr:hypothetical protein [SAR324 cluster bacterium]